MFIGPMLKRIWGQFTESVFAVKLGKVPREFTYAAS